MNTINGHVFYGLTVRLSFNSAFVVLLFLSHLFFSLYAHLFPDGNIIYLPFLHPFFLLTLFLPNLT